MENKTYQLKAVQSGNRVTTAQLEANSIQQWVKELLSISSGMVLYINDGKFWVSLSKTDPKGYTRRELEGEHPFEKGLPTPKEIAKFVPETVIAPTPALAPVLVTAKLEDKVEYIEKSLESMGYMDFIQWAKANRVTKFKWRKTELDVTLGCAAEAEKKEEEPVKEVKVKKVRVKKESKAHGEKKLEVIREFDANDQP